MESTLVSVLASKTILTPVYAAPRSRRATEFGASRFVGFLPLWGILWVFLFASELEVGRPRKAPGHVAFVETPATCLPAFAKLRRSALGRRLAVVLGPEHAVEQVVRNFRLRLVLRGRWFRQSFDLLGVVGGCLGGELIGLSRSAFCRRVAAFGVVLSAHVTGEAHVALLTSGCLDGTSGASDRRVHETCGLLSFPRGRTVILVALLEFGLRRCQFRHDRLVLLHGRLLALLYRLGELVLIRLLDRLGLIPLVDALLQETGVAEILVPDIQVGDDALDLLLDLATWELLLALNRVLKGLHLLLGFLQLIDQLTHVFDAGFLY